MAEGVMDLTDGNFNEVIKEGVTLVDFWAPWCGPCKVQGPIVAEVAAKIGDRAKIAKFNIDEGQNAATTLGIRSIPTAIIFKNGVPAQQLVGLRKEDELISAIEDALSS